MEEAGLFIIVTWLVCASAGSIVFWSNDYRHFSNIQKQCSERGYIQDNNTRINCNIEVLPK